jgi:hypothetical protein
MVSHVLDLKWPALERQSGYYLFHAGIPLFVKKTNGKPRPPLWFLEKLDLEVLAVIVTATSPQLF